MWLTTGMACNPFYSPKQDQFFKTMNSSVQLIVSSDTGCKSNLRMNPGRIYVSSQQNLPKAPRLVQVMLSRLNSIFSDKKSKTINVFIFGATSKKRDLVRNLTPASNPASQPVDYHHFYNKDDVDLQEWAAFGTGRSMTGNSSAIFIWSDFWWLASKIILIYNQSLYSS